MPRECVADNQITCLGPFVRYIDQMRIDGSFPTHVARAYGLAPATKAQPTHKLSLSSQVNAASQARNAQPSANVNQLIAATVSQPIDFNNTATPGIVPVNEALPLYTRAADRIEAATGVQVGRQLDVTG